MDSNALEVWKQIPAPFGFFEASSLGRIRRLLDRFVMSPGRCADGYCRIPLRLVTGGKRTAYVHRLVAMTHCPGDHSLTVNHLNMVKHDNRACNLEWVSFSDNHKKAWVMRPERRIAHGAKLSKPLIATDESGVETQYPSGKAAAIAMGGVYKAAEISRAANVGFTRYGRTWRFAD